jgi:hypothetical protein
MYDQPFGLHCFVFAWLSFALLCFRIHPSENIHCEHAHRKHSHVTRTRKDIVIRAFVFSFQ